MRLGEKFDARRTPCAALPIDLRSPALVCDSNCSPPMRRPAPEGTMTLTDSTPRLTQPTMIAPEGKPGTIGWLIGVPGMSPAETITAK